LPGIFFNRLKDEIYQYENLLNIHARKWDGLHAKQIGFTGLQNFLKYTKSQKKWIGWNSLIKEIEIAVGLKIPVC
jgi:hypothetical protein